ncbi:DUF1194 domain-containing protein [Rhodobacter sp. Har01]|uniref:DUF1194 domain-containing protein n=1 Tax=Rhodobacter sp. Har01 TaxID=2883999 RepID=UPI001D08C54D|nr:DUF1194 domain-containing protein [Rhodobacter sp. Har01]MCB6179684.1 DUF1194 domain-containing protein [Rhodobacter sp. Har01]
MPLRLGLPFALAAAPAAADCRLALALALDVSRSVDAADFVVQTEGLAIALEAPDIRRAFFSTAGDVALAIYQWSGEDHQEVILDWTLVSAPADLDPVAVRLRALPPPERALNTALGRGLGFGLGLMARAPPCTRRVIDVSGDGRNNAGPSPERIYAAGGWDGITVNALAIGAHELDIENYFFGTVIRGPGAFVERAARHTDFPHAIRRKLFRELTDMLSLNAPERRQKS